MVGIPDRYRELKRPMPSPNSTSVGPTGNGQGLTKSAPTTTTPTTTDSYGGTVIDKTETKLILPKRQITINDLKKVAEPEILREIIYLEEILNNSNDLDRKNSEIQTAENFLRGRPQQETLQHFKYFILTGNLRAAELLIKHYGTLPGLNGIVDKNDPNLYEKRELMAYLRFPLSDEKNIANWDYRWLLNSHGLLGPDDPRMLTGESLQKYMIALATREQQAANSIQETINQANRRADELQEQPTRSNDTPSLTPEQLEKLERDGIPQNFLPNENEISRDILIKGLKLKILEATIDNFENNLKIVERFNKKDDISNEEYKKACKELNKTKGSIEKWRDELIKSTKLTPLEQAQFDSWITFPQDEKMRNLWVRAIVLGKVRFDNNQKLIKPLSREEQKQLYEKFKRNVTKEIDKINELLPKDRLSWAKQLQSLEEITKKFLDTRKLYDITDPLVKYEIETENAAIATNPKDRKILKAVAEARKQGGDKLAEELRKLPNELQTIEELILSKVKKLEDEIKGIQKEQAESRLEGRMVPQPSPQKIKELNEEIKKFDLIISQNKDYLSGDNSDVIKNRLLAEINNFILTDDNKRNFLYKNLMSLTIELHNNEQADKLVDSLNDDLDFSKADYDYSISGKSEGLELDRNKLKKIIEKIANSKKFQEGRINLGDENIQELSKFLGDRVSLKRVVDFKNFGILINALKRTDIKEKEKQDTIFANIKSEIQKTINENKSYLRNPSTIELFKLKIKESINEQLPKLIVLTGYKSGAEEVRDKLYKLVEESIVSSASDGNVTPELQRKLDKVRGLVYNPSGNNGFNKKLETVLGENAKGKIASVINLAADSNSKVEVILKKLEYQLQNKNLNNDEKNKILSNIIRENQSDLGNVNSKVIRQAIKPYLEGMGFNSKELLPQIEEKIQSLRKKELILYLKDTISKETKFLPNQEDIKEIEVQVEELIRHDNPIKWDDKYIASLVKRIAEKIDSKKEALSKDKTLINIPGSPIDKALVRLEASRNTLNKIGESIKDIRARTIEDIFATWFVEADAKSLAMLVEKNYTIEQIRQVEQNIILFNSLPSSIRSQIIPSSESQEPIDPKKIAIMLANKELERSGNSFLLRSDFENMVRDLKAKEDTKLAALTTKSRDLSMQEMKLVMELRDHTSKKLPWYVRWFPFASDKDDEFEQKQNELIVRIDKFKLNKKIDLLNTGEVAKEVEGIETKIRELRASKEKIERSPSGTILREVFSSEGYLSLLALNPSEKVRRIIYADTTKLAELDYEIDTLNMLRDILTTENVKERKSKVDEFTERFETLREFRSLYSGIREGMAELQETQLKSMQLELALLRANVAAEKSKGDIEKADEMLLAILMKYGNNLSKLDPKLWEEITRKSDSPADMGTLQRLELTGKLNPKLVKELIEDSSKQKAKPEPTGSVSFEEQYLQTQRQRFNDRQINIDMPLSTLVSLKGNSPAERKFATSLALNKVDNNPAMRKLLSATATINNKVGQLQVLFDAAAKGNKYDEFVKFLQDESNGLQSAFKELRDSSNISDAKYFLRELENTLKETNDPEIKTELEKRIKAVSSVVALAENKSLDEFLKNITDTSKFKSDSWKAWASKDGVILLGTIGIAVATTVLTCGTAAPLWLMALTSTVGGIVGQEIMREGVHTYTNFADPNVRSGELKYTDRSALLKWIGSLNLEKGLQEQIHSFIDEVGNPYAKQFVTQFITTYIAIGAGIKLAQPVGKGIDKAKDAARSIGESLGKVLQKLKDTKAFQQLQDTGFAKAALEKINTFQIKFAKITKEFTGKELSHPTAKAELLHRFAGEFPDELSDELFEGILKEAIDGLTGIQGAGDLIASIVVAGGKGGVRISGASKGQFRIDHKGNPNFNPDQFIAELQRRGIDGQFKVVSNEDGVVTVQDISAKPPVDVTPSTRIQRDAKIPGQNLSSSTTLSHQEFNTAIKDPNISLDKKKEIMCNKAKELVRKYGIPPDAITEDMFDTYESFVLGGNFSHRGGSINIFVNEQSSDPLEILEHELNHFADAVKLTIFFKANPEAFKKVMLEKGMSEIAIDEYIVEETLDKALSNHPKLAEFIKSRVDARTPTESEIRTALRGLDPGIIESDDHYDLSFGIGYVTSVSEGRARNAPLISRYRSIKRDPNVRNKDEELKKLSEEIKYNVALFNKLSPAVGKLKIAKTTQEKAGAWKDVIKASEQILTHTHEDSFRKDEILIYIGETLRERFKQECEVNQELHRLLTNDREVVQGLENIKNLLGTFNVPTRSSIAPIVTTPTIRPGSEVSKLLNDLINKNLKGIATPSQKAEIKRLFYDLAGLLSAHSPNDIESYAKQLFTTDSIKKFIGPAKDASELYERITLLQRYVNNIRNKGLGNNEFDDFLGVRQIFLAKGNKYSGRHIIVQRGNNNGVPQDAVEAVQKRQEQLEVLKDELSTLSLLQMRRKQALKGQIRELEESIPRDINNLSPQDRVRLAQSNHDRAIAKVEKVEDILRELEWEAFAESRRNGETKKYREIVGKAKEQESILASENSKARALEEFYKRAKVESKDASLKNSPIRTPRDEYILLQQYGEEFIAEYNATRRHKYTTDSRHDSNIDRAASAEADGIFAYKLDGWYWRSVSKFKSKSTYCRDRYSLNVVAHPELVKALDRFILEHGGYYKTSRNGERWSGRHDPVSYFPFKKLTPQEEIKLAQIIEPYVRSKEGLFGQEIIDPAGKKYNGIKRQETAHMRELEALIERANDIDPVLGKAIINNFFQGKKPDINMVSAGQVQAVRNVLARYEAAPPKPELEASPQGIKVVNVPDQIKKSQNYLSATRKGEMVVVIDDDLPEGVLAQAETIEESTGRKTQIRVSREVAEGFRKNEPNALRILSEEIDHANQKIIDPVVKGNDGKTTRIMSEEEYIVRRAFQEITAESSSSSRFGGTRRGEALRQMKDLMEQGRFSEAISVAQRSGLSIEDLKNYKADYKANTSADRERLVQRSASAKGDEYGGRHIIGRDTPIDGGVYLGGGAREAVVVDFDKSPTLKAMYRNALAKASSGSKVNPEKFLQSVYDEVKSAMKIQNDAAVDNLVAKYRTDNDTKISLEVFLREGVGVCRHDALACGALIERAIKDGHISGRVSAERNKVLGSAHAWCRYTDSSDIPWILDVRQNRIGKLPDVQRQNNAWSYARPNERPELEGIVNWERTVQGKRRVNEKDDAPQRTINISPQNVTSIIKDKIQSKKPGDSFTVGRSPSSDIVVDDIFMSRTQARISKTKQNGKTHYTVQDGADGIPSHNGTYYEVINPNGSREWVKVTSPVVLPEGTKIRFGGEGSYHIVELPGETKPASQKIGPQKIEPPKPIDPVDISEITTLLRGLKMRQVYKIGRGGTIKIKDPTERLSREHLRIRKISSGNTYLVQDGGAKDKPSMHGTEYRKRGSDRWEKISTGGGILLKSSDEIRLAGEDRFVITLP